MTEFIRKFASKLADKGCLRDKYLEVLGIFDGKYAYKGPFHVQIDLTNDCNNQCIACWCNSPLLKERRLSGDKKKQHLPFEMVKELLDDLKQLGTKEIYYSGGGEPFMHPKIMEILEYTKKNGFVCYVNTNFTLVDRKIIDELIKIKVDFLTVSTWAATPQIYVKTHIGRKEEDFLCIANNLLYLNTHKFQCPKTKLYNVIFNINYREIIEMFEFAKKVKSEYVEFTVVDTIPGATDVLALRESELIEIRDQCRYLKERLDENNFSPQDNVCILQFDQFIRRISTTQNAAEAKYDRNVIDNMPCYIGWLFARIVPNGDIHSCLKAHRIPTGSLYRSRFPEVWNSHKQFYFRKKTRVYKKKDKFFRMIGNDPDVKEAGCYKSCDDIVRNQVMHRTIKAIPLPVRIGIKILSKLTRLKKEISFLSERFSHHSYPYLLQKGIRQGGKAFSGPRVLFVLLDENAKDKLYTEKSFQDIAKEAKGMKIKKVVFLTKGNAKEDVRSQVRELGNIFRKEGIYIENVSLKERQKVDYRKKPCYIGWYASCISSKGDIFLCCNSKNPIGNIGSDTFENIWNSLSYCRLRMYAKYRFNMPMSIDCSRCLHVEEHKAIERDLSSLSYSRFIHERKRKSIILFFLILPVTLFYAGYLHFYYKIKRRRIV